MHGRFFGSGVSARVQSIGEGTTTITLNGSATGTAAVTVTLPTAHVDNWYRHAWKMREGATREAWSVMWHASNGSPRESGWSGRVTERHVGVMKSVNSDGAK